MPSPTDESPAALKETIREEISASPTAGLTSVSGRSDTGEAAASGDTPKREVVGRTGWDIASKLATPIFAACIGAAIIFPISCLIGAWFDLVEVHYDDGLHLRLGLNHQQIERQQQEEVDQLNHKAIEDHFLRVHKFISSFIVNDWTTSWDGQWDSLYVEQSTLRCSWKLHTTLSLRIGSYDPALNSGEGEATSSFNYTESTEIIKEREKLACHQAMLQHVQAQSYTERYHVRLSDSSTPPPDKDPWGIRAQFIQEDCVACSSTTHLLFALPTRELDYVDAEQHHWRMSAPKPPEAH